MLRSYLTIAIRTLLRNRLYASINTIGLTLGMGVAIVLFWIVRFEYSFDGYHRQVDRLYQIRSIDKYGEANSHVPQGVIKALKEQFPGVVTAASVKGTGNTVSVKVGQQVFRTSGLYYAPPELLNMIDVEWLSGSPRQSLGAPGQVVLDQETARLWFGGDPMGKTIRLDNVIDLTVTGIIRKARPNTEFQFQVLVSYETMKRLLEQYKTDEYWGGGDSMFHGYVLLKEGASSGAVEAGLRKLAARHKDGSNYVSYELVPLTEAHFDTETDAFNYAMPRWMLFTLGATAVFLVVIACINFINLATVQAIERSREIAVRKVLGSRRGQLIAQFYGETAVLVCAATGIGSVMATQVARYADQLLNTKVGQAAVWDGGTVGFLVLLAALVTLLAGFYPALVLSGLEPVRALRGRLAQQGRRNVSLRKTLVVAQFVIAQVLVICTLVGAKQIRYFYQKDLGFDKSGVVTVPFPKPSTTATRERFRRQLLQHPEIKDVAFALVTPASLRHWSWGTVRHHHLPNGEYEFRFQYADTNYFHFFKIPLVAGRSWTRADTGTVVIINEKAARELGFGNPEQSIGERIHLYYDKPFTVMGVVKDYHSQSLRSSIVPHVFLYADWAFQEASIRVEPGQEAAALRHIETYWKSLYPDYYYEPKYLDDDIKSFYANERKLSNFLTLFSVIGILIGCLGLFGLVSFVVVQRTREIGIRKVLGASVAHVVVLLSSDFLKLILVAFTVAAPIAGYLMQQFLREYTYNVGLQWWIFPLAGGLSVGVALLTVGFQSIRAATANPVKSLRNE